MRGLRLKLAALLLVLPACAAPGLADVKIKNRQTMSGQASEQTTYIKGKRQRTEMMDGKMTAVQQCDLRRDLQISHATKTYTITPYGAPDSASTPAPAAAPQPAGSAAVTRGVLVSTIVTNKDTGERKQMFGYTARHVITTIVTESSPDACTPYKSRMEIDGWYIDAAFAFSCDDGGRYQNYRPAPRAGCQDRHEYKQLGAAKTGLPVWMKMTMFGEDGRETSTMLQETIELSQETLDAALFDVPAGYREVKDASELYAAAAGATGDASRTQATSDGGGAADGSSESGLGASVREKSRPKSDAAPAALGAKREGVIRLAIAAVKTGAVGDGMSAADLASAVQNTLAEYLKGPSVELVPLEARLPAQIDAEARQKECDFVVYASVSHKKGGGGGFGKMFGGGASVLGAVAPVGGMASSTAGAVAGQVATTVIYTAANLSANVKSKDELTLDVKVQAPGGAAPAAARQFKAKAKSNGEDIISPLIEQAAQAVMDAAAKR